MRFTGQIRIPEVDHPGIPASILIEENQVEILLEGESLGRWSLYDVQARRLVSAAFQLILDGEEVTFIADEPVDFAYRGVDHMDEARARIAVMRAIPRSIAIKKSRQGTKPSRIEELRQAMEANLQAEARVRSAPPRPRYEEPESLPTLEPDVSQWIAPASGEHPDPLDGERARLEEERARLEEERRRLEEERQRLEELRREAEERDARRIEAFRLEMARLEAERAEHERIEAERSRRFQEEMEKLRIERERLQELETQLTTRAGEDAAREDAVRAELQRLEEARLEMERAEAERLEAAKRAMEEVEAKRRELERLEALQTEMAEREAELAAQAEAEAAAAAEAEAVAAAAAADETPEEEEAPVEVAVFAGTPDDEDPPSEPEVVDLDELDETGDKEPALAGAAARGRSGIFGVVKSAFSRSSRNHVHDFVPAPGGMGISRSICRECGYVSISSD